MNFVKDEIDMHAAVPIPERLRKNKKIAIITDNEAEDIEFFYPYYRFNEAGYDVDVITSKGGSFECKNGAWASKNQSYRRSKSRRL